MTDPTDLDSILEEHFKSWTRDEIKRFMDTLKSKNSTPKKKSIFTRKRCKERWTYEDERVELRSHCRLCGHTSISTIKVEHLTPFGNHLEGVERFTKSCPSCEDVFAAMTKEEIIKRILGFPRYVSLLTECGEIPIAEEEEL